ncbi:unnamed protein product, partial [Nesidiocoris tenuis]
MIEKPHKCKQFSLIYLQSGPRAANQCLYGPSGVSPPVMMVPSTTSTMFGIPQFAPVPVFTQMTPPPTVDSSQSLQQVAISRIMVRCSTDAKTT